MLNQNTKSMRRHGLQPHSISDLPPVFVAGLAQAPSIPLFRLLATAPTPMRAHSALQSQSLPRQDPVGFWDPVGFTSDGCSAARASFFSATTFRMEGTRLQKLHLEFVNTKTVVPSVIACHEQQKLPYLIVELRRSPKATVDFSWKPRESQKSPRISLVRQDLLTNSLALTCPVILAHLLSKRIVTMNRNT